MKKLLLISIALLVIVSAWYCFSSQKTALVDQTATTTATNTTTPDLEMIAAQKLIDEKKDLITLDTLKAGSRISSPVEISGQARGIWYFEASFPIELQDANRKVLAQGIGSAQDDWMTENFVPFTLTLNYKAQKSGTKGYIIFHKDNPSGMPENDDSIEVPIVFK